jgi:hypothetical protein
MKRLQTLCLLVLSGAAALQAQPEIHVGHATAAMSRGERPAFTATLQDAVLDDAEKVLKDHMKDYKGKWTGNSKSEIFVDDATIKAMSDNTVDVYVKLFQASKDVKIVAFFDLGGAYVSAETHPEAAKTAEALVRDYVMHYYRVRTEQELDAAEDQLKDLEKTLDGLVKDNEKRRKDIGSQERNIERARQDIAQNETDQDRQRAEIETQKDVIVKLSGAPEDQEKDAQKTLKGMEKDLDKLEKEHEKMHQSIADAQSSISEHEREIEKAERDIKEQEKAIKAQKDAVREIESRLAAFPKR